LRLISFEDAGAVHGGVLLGREVVPLEWLDAPRRHDPGPPGDIIATGTPAGIGAGRERFLRDGDTVEIEVAELGTLSNRVRAE
jgi:Fumarylacetoacetate (FAA) hydrolase family